MQLPLVAIVFYFHICTAYIELVSERGFEDREFRLTCRHLSSRIAVMEATFTPIQMSSLQHNDLVDISVNFTDITNTSLITYYVPTTTTATTIVYEDQKIRLALNQRCSGRNHCSFILHIDCPGSKFWGPGEIFIKYACMAEEHVTRFCNQNLTIPNGGGLTAQGFITSPGYPKFYVGQSNCRWQLLAPIHQRIEIILLDVSLSGSYRSDGLCEDELIIVDSGLERIRTCSEFEKSPIILSETNIVELIVLGRSGSLVAKRGVLIYYRAIECPTVAPPIDGYLVHRNISAATYMCCVGYVFPDTLERTKTLRCLQNKWDSTLPGECIVLNHTQHRTEPVKDLKSKMSEGSQLVDVVIPSILIAGLLLGNAVVVFIIYKYKKRKNLDIHEEEMHTMVSGSTNVP